MLRAAHLCSLPTCRKRTVTPHSDGVRPIITGRAAHIQGKAPTSKRYLAMQTSDERSSQSNGIWVCGDCHDKIDKDESKYTVELLHKWKREHESWVAGEDIIPSLPTLRLQTLDGAILPMQGAFEINVGRGQAHRDHEISVVNSSRHELFQLRLRIQFPENIVSCALVNPVPGVTVAGRFDRTEMMIAGNGSAVRIGEPPPINCYLIQIDKLVSQRPVKLRLRTMPIDKDENEATSKSHGLDGNWEWFVGGEFLYRDQEQYFERIFVAKVDVLGNRKYAICDSEEFTDQKIWVISHML